MRKFLLALIAVSAFAAVEVPDAEARGFRRHRTRRAVARSARSSWRQRFGGFARRSASAGGRFAARHPKVMRFGSRLTRFGSRAISRNPTGMVIRNMLIPKRAYAPGLDWRPRR